MLQQKADEVRNAYARIVKTCMDYAMGCDFEAKGKSYFSGEYGGLVFLGDLDVSNINFAGVSVVGQMVTEEYLAQESKSGADKAIIKASDLMALEDGPRKEALYNHLKIMRGKRGFLEKDDMINLIPLHIAAAIGDIDAVNTRHMAGNDPNDEDTLRSPLVLAALNGHEDIVKILMEAHNDHEKSKTVVIDAIEAARRRGFTQIVNYLEAQQDVNEQNDRGYALLHMAIMHGDVPRVRELILKGADVNLATKKGETPLEIAAKHSMSNEEISEAHTEIVKLLLANHVDPNKSVYALDLAVRVGNVDILAILLPLIKKIDIEKEERSTKLMQKYPWYMDLMFDALGKDNGIAILTLLKAYDADFNVKNERGDALLTKAVSNLPYFRYIKLSYAQGKDEVRDIIQAKFAWLDYLLEQGADPSIPGRDGQTPLARLIENNDLSHFEEAEMELILDRFLTHGADVDAVDDNGLTPLHEAAKRNDVASMKYLLDHAALINCKDIKNRTPLHYAALEGNVYALKLLLARCADFTVLDGNHMTALQLAKTGDVRQLITKFISPCEAKESTLVKKNHNRCLSNSVVKIIAECLGLYRTPKMPVEDVSENKEYKKNLYS